MRLTRPKLSKEKDMKMTWKKMSAVLSLVLAGALLTATAAAQCSNTEALPKAKLHRQSWEVGRDGASLNLVSDSTDPIVGMWRFQFLEGTTVIDQGIVQWHSDGTEMTNSSRNPDTQFLHGSLAESRGLFVQAESLRDQLG